MLNDVHGYSATNNLSKFYCTDPSKSSTEQPQLVFFFLDKKQPQQVAFIGMPYFWDSAGTNWHGTF